MTREEILEKYPSAGNCKTETLEDERSHGTEQFQMLCGSQPYSGGPNENQQKPVFMGDSDL